MELSNDTKKVLDYLDNITRNGLRKKNDLGVLLELGATYGLALSFNEIVFKGTYLWNIHSTLKKLQGSGEGTDKLKNEYKLTLSEFGELLSVFVIDGDEIIINRFKETYFIEEHGAFFNLIDLAHDFAQLKKIQIDGLPQNPKK